jgi:hypothetical protein
MRSGRQRMMVRKLKTLRARRLTLAQHFRQDAALNIVAFVHTFFVILFAHMFAAAAFVAVSVAAVDSW